MKSAGPTAIQNVKPLISAVSKKAGHAFVMNRVFVTKFKMILAETLPVLRNPPNRRMVATRTMRASIPTRNVLMRPRITVGTNAMTSMDYALSTVHALVWKVDAKITSMSRAIPTDRVRIAKSAWTFAKMRVTGCGRRGAGTTVCQSANRDATTRVIDPRLGPNHTNASPGYAVFPAGKECLTS